MEAYRKPNSYIVVSQTHISVTHILSKTIHKIDTNPDTVNSQVGWAVMPNMTMFRNNQNWNIYELSDA